MGRTIALALSVVLASTRPACAARAEDPADTAIAGGDVADICSAAGSAAALACSAYLRGISDGLLAAETNADDDAIAFCPPSDGIGSNQIRQIFLTFMREDPDRRSEDAGTLLLAALEDRFPCDNAGGRDDATNRVAYSAHARRHAHLRH